MAIARHGYDYDPGRESSVAYFPAYPMLVRALLAVAPLSLQWAGLAVSHLALVGAYGLFLAYARQRLEGHNPRAAQYALAALALFPTGLFMRMAYTESLFLLLCMAAFLGMERRWPLEALTKPHKMLHLARNLRHYRDMAVVHVNLERSLLCRANCSP